LPYWALVVKTIHGGLAVPHEKVNDNERVGRLALHMMIKVSKLNSFTIRVPF
jgi:hypothetical protein